MTTEMLDPFAGIRDDDENRFEAMATIFRDRQRAAPSL